jgi:hypothetical protein
MVMRNCRFFALKSKSFRAIFSTPSIQNNAFKREGIGKEQNFLVVPTVEIPSKTENLSKVLESHAWKSTKAKLMEMTGHSCRFDARTAV